MMMTPLSPSSRRRRDCMTTSDMRGDVKSLLDELKHSCRIPLLDQVVGNQGDSARHNMHSPALERSASRSASDEVETASRASSEGTGKSFKRQRREDQSFNRRPERRWDELLADASTLLPFMTVEEHGAVSRLTSICLLGYLIPNSTGNEFFISQDYYPKTMTDSLPSSSEKSPNDNMDSWFWQIPLEERLENSTRFHVAHEYGEVNVFSSELLQAAFNTFIEKGLAPFLAGRPAHREETDLLHILAMAISSEATTEELREDKVSAQRTKRLMKSLHPHYFHLQYKDRLRLVRLVANHLVLPEQEDGPLSANVDSPLMDGALPHLRACLHAFTLEAMSPLDAHWAHSAIVNISTQTGQSVSDEWDALLTSLVQDDADYGCCCSIAQGQTSPQMTKFCAHTSRGELMERFIFRYNGSRHYADEKFTRRALSSLTEVIQLRRDNLTNENSSKNRKTTSSPCQLASLLSAAASLFYFFLVSPMDEDDSKEDEQVIETVDDQFADAEEDVEKAGEPSDDGVKEREAERKRRNQLVKCAITLLQHPDVIVSSKASSLLATAFAYGPQRYTDKYARDALASIRVAFRQSFHFKTEGSVFDVNLMSALICGLESMVVVMARHSIEFASSLISFLASQRGSKWKATDKEKDELIGESVLRLVSAVLVAQPKAASKQFEVLRTCVSEEQSHMARSHVVAALFSCRQAHFFAKETQVAKYQSLANGALSGLSDPWTRYKLARHALVTSNFKIAHEIYQGLLQLSSTEKSYLWLCTLSKIAEAETALSDMGPSGFSSHHRSMHASLTYLFSLSALNGGTSQQDFSFQIEFISLRLDMLELCITMRGLASEIRLTGVVPKSNTRSGLHMHNMQNCFFSLASKYFRFYRRFGLAHCQQSKTAIRTLFSLCRFLGRAAGKVFAEVSKDSSATSSNSLWPKGDSHHPMTRLITELDDLVVKPMNESIDPIVRAAALIELLKGLLMAPLPFPRGFTNLKSLPLARLRLSADPCQVASTVVDDTSEHNFGYDEEEAIPTEADVVNAYPGFPYVVYLVGTIPNAYFKLSKLPFSHVVAWYKVSYDAPLHTEDEGLLEEQTIGESKQSTNPLNEQANAEEEVPPASSPLLPGGKFCLSLECQPVREEGFYKLEVTLGCRDIRCGEWEIPVAPGFQTMFVRVSRSSP